MSTESLLRRKRRLKRKRKRFPAWSSESHTQNSSGCGAARFACERPYVRRRRRARPTCVAFGAFGGCSIRFTSRINYDIIIVRRKRIEQVRAAFGVEEEISAFLLSGYVLRPSGTEYRFLRRRIKYTVPRTKEYDTGFSPRQVLLWTALVCQVNARAFLRCGYLVLNNLIQL